MKYVKLTAKPDTWFVEGTEVWDYYTDIRLKESKFNPQDFSICVRGIRRNEPDFNYEKELIDRGIIFRTDGEACSPEEFNVDIVDSDGSEEISQLIKKYTN